MSCPEALRAKFFRSTWFDRFAMNLRAACHRVGVGVTLNLRRLSSDLALTACTTT